LFNFAPSEKQFTDDCLINLAQSFKTLKFLTNLSLKLEACAKITDAGLMSLSEALKKASYLKSIDLNFSWFVLKRRFFSISNRCSNLKNESLNHLSKCFQRLSSLEKINLNFEGCYQITDIGLSHLKEALMTNSLLKEANLLFME